MQERNVQFKSADATDQLIVILIRSFAESLSFSAHEPSTYINRRRNTLTDEGTHLRTAWHTDVQTDEKNVIIELMFMIQM